MHLNPLRNLLEANKGKGLFKAEVSGDEATIFLYDIIVRDDMWGGVSALAFAQALAQVTASKIHLRIDSPGGDVFASVAMAQHMREHKAEIIVHVDGFAASAATQLLMAGDKSVISPGGQVMIHKAWSIAAGNSDDFDGMSALLHKIDNQIAESYAAKTGKDVEELMTMMKAETWMTEKEAVEMGFVDALAEPNPDKIKTMWDMSAYKAAPKVEPAPNTPEPAPKAEDETIIPNNDNLRRHLRITVGAN
jgi:ATP-dependent Clp protease protease subunit